MSDYTPTTEEVRNVYVWWMANNLVARGLAEPKNLQETYKTLYEEFDSWLETVNPEAVQEYLERGDNV